MRSRGTAPSKDGAPPAQMDANKSINTSRLPTERVRRERRGPPRPTSDSRALELARQALPVKRPPPAPSAVHRMHKRCAPFLSVQAFDVALFFPEAPSLLHVATSPPERAPLVTVSLQRAIIAKWTGSPCSFLVGLPLVLFREVPLSRPQTRRDAWVEARARGRALLWDAV